MIEIAFRRGFSEVVAGLRVATGEQGKTDRKRPKLAHQSGLDMIFIFPGPRQQFIEAVDGMPVDHAREHIAQVGVGFDAVEFAGFDQRTDDRPPVTATVASGKEMVLPPERHRADRAFDRIGIEFNAAVMQERVRPSQRESA